MKKHTQFVVAAAVIVVLATTVVGMSYMVPNYYSQGQPGGISPVKGQYLEQFRDMSPEQMINKIWLDVCAMNRGRYPDSNKVQPGDTIQLPLGQYYVAQRGGTDHMWRAAIWFTDALVQPYLRFGNAPDTNQPVVAEVQGPSVPTTSNGISLWWLLILIPILVGIGWASNRLQQAKKFVRVPPHFKGGTDEVVRPAAETALRSALGHGIQIVGNIERGVINGTQVMFNADGTSQTETFVNEPGYRAIVRFPNGEMRIVVCRWSCFNPVWSLKDADFAGTFTPVGFKAKDPILRMDPQGVEQLESSIRGSESIVADDLPANAIVTSQPLLDLLETARSEAPKVGKTDVQVASVPTAVERQTAIAVPGTADLTKLQFFKDGGVVMEGRLNLTVQDLHGMLYQITGRHPSQLEPKPEAAKTDKPVTAAPEPNAPTSDASSSSTVQ